MPSPDLATQILWITLGVIGAIVVLSLGYFAACAGAEKWLTFRQWWGTACCFSHRYDLADLKPRDKDGMVSCACHKCGKVSRAECGLTLPGFFDRNTSSTATVNKREVA